MRLDEVPPGPVYVDTNVWHMYLRSDRQYLAVVRSFLERVIKGEIVALVGVWMSCFTACC
jgi:predicted nucleic acid-binding protein